MPTKVIMPQMGESIYEGTVTKWLKKVGERVKRDEPLFEISTDKVDTEIPCPASGTLTEIKVKEGEKVPINTIVAMIDEAGKGGAKATPPKQVEAATVKTPPVADLRSEPATATKTSREGRAFSSPLVRRIARDEKIDLAQLKGTGAGGRISKNDILSYIAKRREAGAVAERIVQSPSPVRSAQTGTEIVPMTQMRQKIAEHMVMSKRTSPHVTTVFEIDLSKVSDLYEREKGYFAESLGTKLTYTHFFAKAVVNCLREFPFLNSSIEGDKIIVKHFVNLGIAVALPEGLIVPVVRHAEEMSFLGLARTINDVAERARTKKLTPDDVQGGTFTITNPGIYGGLFGTPIISQPQVAIIGIGGIKKRPVVIGDAIAIRPMVYLALSFDHRVLDGAVSDQFMARLKEVIENWDEGIR